MLAVTLLCANAPVLYAKAAAPYPEPAKAIVEEYDIPEEAWEQTSVITVGWSPTAGCPWRRSLLRTPILVSDNITNGAHDLIFQRTGGGGETEYVRLACSDGVYTSPVGAKEQDKTKVWTIAIGTVFVKGNVVLPDATRTALEPGYDDVYQVTKVDKIDFESPDMQHWEMGSN